VLTLSKEQNLADTARSTIAIGAGTTLVIDVLQFGGMLLMVRLLTPEDYGSAALAQSFVGLISVLSFTTFAGHALQVRDPSNVDWQAHFSAAVVINCSIFLLTLLVALFLSSTQRYEAAALPLAVIAVVFLLEIPALLRRTMLQTQHDWVRLSGLTLMGTFLGLSAGLAIAFLDGGVWALVVQPPLLVVPFAIDLFWRGNWRPDFSLSWGRYRSTVFFSIYRMGSAVAIRGRPVVEQSVMVSAYDFGFLGVFTRTMGLASLVAGRMGSVAMQALYPVITRAEIRSEKFQRMAGIVLQGVCWTTIPAAVFFALHANETVSLLYGEQWLSVVPLLPLALMGIAFNGIATTLSGLLLANNESRLCLIIDITGTIIAVGLAMWLVPIGFIEYLAALAILGFAMVMVVLAALMKTNGLSGKLIKAAFLPSIVACSVASVITEIGRYLVEGSYPTVVQLIIGSGVFVAVYILVLRFAFASSMRALIELSPGGKSLMRWLQFSHPSQDLKES